MKQGKTKLIIIQIIPGMIYGAATAVTLLQNKTDTHSINGFLREFLVFMIAFLCAFYLQVIIHEGGHLVFGLLSGYRFLSFRIGNIIILNDNGRLVIKKYSLAGTLGQCLMAPPEYDNGNYPAILYHMGGVLMNFISVIIFIFIKVIFKPVYFFNSLLNMLIACGIVMILSNGIPLKTDLLNNDGYNALNHNKDKKIARSNWITLKIYELTCKGIRMKDMDKEWFRLEENYDPKDYETAVTLTNLENIAMESHDFDRAESILNELLVSDSGVLGLNRNLLTLDRVYLDLLKKGKEADISVLDSKEIKSFLKAMKDYPSVLRTKYAINLVKGDLKKAELIRKRFNKVSLTYPYPGDIKAEEDLMDHIKSAIV